MVSIVRFGVSPPTHPQVVLVFLTVNALVMGTNENEVQED